MKKTFYFSFVKSFWVIDNNDKVLESMNKLNKRGSVKTINTFDFLTLYTKIPHDKLLLVLDELIHFCFKGDTHELLSVTKYNERWVKGRTKSGLLFNIKQAKEALHYLMSNCHFSLGEKLQTSGWYPYGFGPCTFLRKLFSILLREQMDKESKKD